MKPDFNNKKLLPLLYIAGSFFAARCMLFNMLCPVGCAYLSLSISRHSFWFALFGSVLGVVSQGDNVNMWSYIFAFTGMGIINGAIKGTRLSLTERGKAFTAAFTMTMGGLTGAVIEGELFCFAVALMQGLLSGLLSFVFFEGIYALKRGGGNELYGFTLLIGCLCGGMGDIAVFGIPLSLVLLALLLPVVMGKSIITSSDGTYLRQHAGGRLESFARSIDSLAISLNAVTDSIDEKEDIARLKKSLKKSRSLLSQELTAVSALIKGLSAELKDELAPDAYLGKSLKERLKREGISCCEVLAYKWRDIGYQVDVVRRCRGNCGKCLKRTTKVISDTLGIEMVRENSFCFNEGQRRILRLCPQRTFRISAYGAVKKRDGSSVSGDSHTFMELKYGKYMLALSDGMGSGGKAREESAASVELFEDFMEAGFERDMALDQINSLLLMRAGDEDIFATLDICNVDLYSGKAEFVKIGGMPSFIAGKNGVKLIGGGGLPIGIMDSAEKESVEIQLESGDTIVMITDGVAEAAPCVIGKENWLARIIDENSSLSPEKLCQVILDTAIEADNGKIKDDMTVMVAKVWKIV